MADREAQSRERALRHSRAQVDSIRDIGPPPEIVDPDRRERCRYDLRTFLETYFPKVFFLGWSADHEMLLKETQSVVLDGGKVCVAMPRGSGKTSVFQGAMIWASIYGHQRFTIMLLADATNFKRLLNEPMLEWLSLADAEQIVAGGGKWLDVRVAAADNASAPGTLDSDKKNT